MGFWDDKKPPKEDFATKDDISKMKKDVEKLLKDKDEPDTKGATKRLVGGFGKGFGDIAKSLASNENKKRMRIAQMPGKKTPIARTNISNPIAGNGAGIKRRKISYAPDD